MKILCRVALASVLAFMLLGAAAQDKSGVVSAAKSKFGPLPGVPACLTLSVQGIGIPRVKRS